MKNSIRQGRAGKFTLLTLSTIAVLTLAAGTLHADPVTGYSITGTPNQFYGYYSAGFEFSPTQDFSISALGYWVKDDATLINSHSVAIFYAQDYNGFHAGDLVTGASVVVAIADAGPGLNIGTGPNSYFAYHALTADVLLVQGVHYRIAGDMIGLTAGGSPNTGDWASYEVPGNHTNTAPITTYSGYFLNISPTVTTAVYPTIQDGTWFYSTPNFIVAAAVPEPSSIALVCIGGVVFLSWRSKTRPRCS